MNPHGHSTKSTANALKTVQDHQKPSHGNRQRSQEPKELGRRDVTRYPGWDPGTEKGQEARTGQTQMRKEPGDWDVPPSMPGL